MLSGRTIGLSIARKYVDIFVTNVFSKVKNGNCYRHTFVNRKSKYNLITYCIRRLLCPKCRSTKYRRSTLLSKCRSSKYRRNTLFSKCRSTKYRRNTFFSKCRLTKYRRNTLFSKCRSTKYRRNTLFSPGL